MCPEPVILSAYFDGELAEPLKSTVTAHTGHCPVCQATMQQLQKMRDALIQSPVQSPTLPHFSWPQEGKPGIRAVHASPLQRFWRYVSMTSFGQYDRMRSISVPLPVLAAAFSILFLVIALSFLPKFLPSLDKLVEEEDQRSAVLTINLSPRELENFLESIEEKFNNDIHIIHQMPDQIPVTRFGEPQMLRTASIEIEL